MTNETPYVEMNRSYRAALKTLYEADIPEDERKSVRHDIGIRLAEAMDTAPIPEFIVYCQSVVSKYQSRRSVYRSIKYQAIQLIQWLMNAIRNTLARPTDEDKT
jgi:hypothetical protein